MRSMKFPPVLSVIALVSSWSAVAMGEDFWPEFRGSKADGHAPAGQFPVSWSGDKDFRWKVEIPGKAWSSPVVADGKVFLTTAVDDGSKVALGARCLSLTDGSLVWERGIFEKDATPIHQKNSHASPTPIHAEGKVYVHFGHNGTACLNAADGSIVWTQTSLSYAPVHGNGGSPVLHDGKLIFSCDGQADPFVVALKTSDGSVAWKTPRKVEVQRTFSFATPLLIEVNGKAQVVAPGSGAVIAYDPADGREIWRFRYGEGYSVVPRPLFRDGIVYVCSGFNRAVLHAVKADGTGDVTETHQVWQDDKTVPKESSPILVDDLLYFNDDKGILSCLEAATGKEVYRERLDGKGGYSASPVFAGGHLYFHNGDGITTVVKPGRTFTRVAENPLGEYGLSSFAVVSDGFLVRTGKNLVRIGK
jgi:outer membrane protein assembly factor BamB